MVMAIAGTAQAMIGAANSRSESIEMPTLVASFTNAERTLQSNLDATHIRKLPRCLPIFQVFPKGFAGPPKRVCRRVCRTLRADTS
jgi:hypothetical protein